MFEPNCILVKNAPEIHLKTTFVERYFLKKLKGHIKFALEKNNAGLEGISSERGRLVLKLKDLKKGLGILKNVFGIHAVSIAQEFNETDFGKIVENSLSCCENFSEGDTFAVRASVAENNFFRSRDLEMELGERILGKFPFLKVSLKNPEKEVFVEVKKNSFYIFFENSAGLGGLPLGCEGNVAIFAEKSDEFLVSAFLMMKRGCNIYPVIREKSPEFEKFLEKIVPFNCFREFFLTEEKSLQKLVEEKEILAFIDCSGKLDGAVLRKIEKNKKEFSMPFFYPLVCFPQNKFDGILKLVKNE